MRTVQAFRRARATPSGYYGVPWDRAACRGRVDMEWDFSDWYPSKKDILACREVCSGCPIRQQCLDYAVVNERYGFWGGSTAAERGQARKRKRIGPGKEAV